MCDQASDPTCCGSCDNNVIWGCECFNSTSATAGATTLARLFVLQDTGQLDSSTANGIIANIVSYGYTIANVQCKQAFVNTQEIDLECNNPAGAIVPNNPNCLSCKAQALEVARSRRKLEQDAKAKNPHYKIQTVTPAIAAAYFGSTGSIDTQISNDGVCQYVCEQCVAENLSQNIQMKMVEECSNRVTSEEFLNAFTSGMSQQAETELTKHQAGLKSTGVDIKNQDDIKKLSIEISDTIRQMTVVKQLSALNQEALNIQETKIDPGSTSVVLQNSSQSITVSMFASLVSRTYTDVNVKNSIDYQSQQKTIQIETSFSDLVKSLETTVKTMDSLLISTVGKIMITVVALLLIIMIIFASFFFFKPDFLFGSIMGGEDGTGQQENDI